MANKIKNVFIFLILFVFYFIELLFSTLFSVFRIKEHITNGSFWFSVFYQVFLVIITFYLFSTKIDSLIYDYIYGQGNLVSAIILSIELITLILFFNACIEFILRLIYKDDTFDVIFSLQKSGHNYMMTIISLIAIYSAIDTYHANEINTMLLVFGILIFICIVITDLYNSLFLSQNIVKNISNQLQSHYEKVKQQ